MAQKTQKGIVLVTGGARGIGRATAALLAKRFGRLDALVNIYV